MVVGIIDINANFNTADRHAERAAFALVNQNFAALNASVIELNNRTFNPVLIPNLAVWLDADDSSTIALSGENVTQWNNKGNVAGVAHASQATALRQPIRVTNALNGRQGIQGRHNSVNGSQLDIADSSGLDYTQFTSFLVFKRFAELAATETPISKYATASPQREFKLDITDHDYVSMITSANGTASTTLVGITQAVATLVNTPRIVTISYDGVNQSVGLFNQGAPVVAAQSTVFNGTGKYTLFAREDFNDPYAGFIFEHLFFTRLLTELESTAILNYLSTKWAIT